MQMKTGKVAGTGAAINVSLGFTPLFVMVANTEDSDTVDFAIFCDDTSDSMAAGTAITIAAAAAARASNGLSQYAGSESAAAGFTIGSGISESGKDLHWVAFG